MSAPERTDLWLPTAVTGDDFVGPYRLIREAGSGGMGVVYLAVDKDERPVAVKVLRDHIAYDADARARLRRELTTMRRVHDRYIADVVDADLEAERPYIVSEFVDGPQLDDYVSEVGPLGREGLVTLGRGLLSALEAIHSVGVVHRDLKPGNVLLEGHRPVVIDFGIAQLADETRLTMTGLFVGTPGYVSPETIYGDPATPATDWWSWAAVMAYASTGASPAGKGPIEVVLDRIRRGELRLDTVDADLRPLLQDCLAVRPEDRPGVREIRSRFDAYAAGGGTGPARVVAPIPLVTPTSQPTPSTEAPASRTPAPGPLAANDPAADSPATDGPPATAVLPQPTGHVFHPDRVEEPHDQRPAPDLRRNEQPQSVEQPARRARARSTAPPTKRTAGLPVFAFAVLLTAAAMSMPVASALLLFVLLTAARTIDGFIAGVRWRREIGSTARRASLVQTLGTPWTAVKAAVVSLGTLLLPGALAAGASYGAHALIPQHVGATGYLANISVGLGATVGLLVLWYGPGSRGTKASAHRSLRALAPTQQSVLALTAVLLIAAAAIALVVYRFPVLDWFPLPASPTRGLW